MDFSKQFTFKPVVMNGKKLKNKDAYVVCGMGGSQLAASLLRNWDHLDIIPHRDYGLPNLNKIEMKRRLFIFSSYSGNTAETISGFKQALKAGLAMAAIAVGGELLALAKKHNVPYVELPHTGIQPRSALGFSLMGLLKLMGEDKAMREAKRLAKSLNPKSFESMGKKLALQLKDRVPVIYATNRNISVAYNWKIKLNETGKIPAFYNVLPELNHNEMNGFDVTETSKHLSERFTFIFLTDAEDNKYNKQRMQVLHKLFSDRKLPVIEVPMEGRGRFHRMFMSLLIADWTAIYIADLYGLESEQVPMVEEFKRLID